MYACWNNIILYTGWEEAIFADRCPTNSYRVFYIHDIDWQNSNIKFEHMLKLFDSANLVVCPSANYQAINDHFGISPLIINDLNLEQIYENCR